MPTNIEWTDETWNPMTGCTKISAGCDNCYALALSERKLRSIYLGRTPVKDTNANRSNPFAPRYWADRLEKPLGWRKPRRIFVNSMSDIFHGHFSLDQIHTVFEVMNAASWHHFQILTKRPERALRLADSLPWSPNIWIGTSIENEDVSHRLVALKQISQASVRFISAEPLLGPLGKLDLAGIEWVIGGGESGPAYRPCDPAWASQLRDLCEQQGVPFFWKQWGGRSPKSGGRLLDGREYSNYPLQLPGD
jgi:protein gp37